MTSTQSGSEPVDISDPAVISQFLDWAAAHIREAVGIDKRNGSLLLREFDDAPEVAVHFEPREWAEFANWFKTVGGPQGDVNMEALFDLLATYVDQGLVQNTDSSDLYLYSHGIWPLGLVPRES